MRDVFAGWVAGYLMGMASTIALVYLSRPGGALARLREAALPGTAPLAFGILAFLGAATAWTMAGLVLGSIYRTAGFADRPDGLCSPSLAFTTIMLLVALAPLPVLLLLARRDWPAWAGLAAAFGALFGWLLPLLGAR